MRRKHTHDMRPVAVWYPPPPLASVLAGNPAVTLILYRCSCGNGPDAVDSKALAGRWTVAQLDIQTGNGRHEQLPNMIP
jgi:hypothetical protein